MSKKDVAFLVGYFPTVSETFIVNQINSLMDLGWNVHLFAYNKNETKVHHDSLKRYNLLDNVRYFVKAPISKFARFRTFIQWTIDNFYKINWRLYFKTLNVFKYGKEAYSLKLFYEAQWFLTPFSFDIIHSHFGMFGNRIADLKAKGIIPREIKLITTFHGYDLVPTKLNDYKKEYKVLLEENSAFTVNTPYLKGLLKEINYLNKSIYILPVGLDTDFFERKDKERDAENFHLVFCGKLIIWKGPDIAIDVISELVKAGHQNIRLHIIGEGKLKSTLVRQVETEKLGDHVYFHGALSQNEIKEHFSRADAFILPGRYEPFTERAETQGLVIQEAQAMKLPVIVSDVGGMPYGLIPGKTGFILKEGDISGFVRTIEKLMFHPDLKKEIGEVGRQMVREKYDNKVLVSELTKIYEELIIN